MFNPFKKILDRRKKKEGKETSGKKPVTTNYEPKEKPAETPVEESRDDAEFLSFEDEPADLGVGKSGLSELVNEEDSELAASVEEVLSEPRKEDSCNRSQLVAMGYDFKIISYMSGQTRADAEFAIKIELISGKGCYSIYRGDRGNRSIFRRIYPRGERRDGKDLKPVFRRVLDIYLSSRK